MNRKDKRSQVRTSSIIFEEIVKISDQQNFLSHHINEIYEFICENSDEFICILSSGGKIIYQNSAFNKLGYGEKALIGNNYIDFLHTEDIEPFSNLLIDLADQKRNISLHENQLTLYSRFVLKSGEWIELKSNLHILKEQPDQFAVLIISRDITDSKQSINEIKEWTDTFDTFVAKFDINGFMIFCNASLLNLAGVSESDLFGKYFPDTRLFSHSKIEKLKIVRCLNNSKAYLPSRIECTFLGAGNRHIPAIFNCQPVIDETGDIKYITGEGKTIMEEILLRDKLLEANSNLEKRINERTAQIIKINKELNEDIKKRRIAENKNIGLAAFPRESPHPIVSCNTDGNIIYINPAVQNLVEGLGLDSPVCILPENHNELIKQCFDDLKSYNNLERRIKGHVFSWTYNPIPDIAMIHLHGLDVTDQKYFEEKLLHDTLHDNLTGLPNRSFFYDTLLRSIKIAQRRNDYHFAVLFMDMGKFKVINDSMGHLTGDKVLVEVAGRLSSCLRPEDMAARFGGDEFTILLNNIMDANDPVRVTERIHKNLSLPLLIEGHEIIPSASIGIALSSHDYTKPEDIIRDANTAMYKAKAEGTSRYVIFNNTMNKQAIKLLELENNLQYALASKEFCIYYQPIVSFDTGRIAGFEALLRWQHPKRGLILPDDFLPMIEETGQIVPIGEWSIRKACSQLRTWHKKYSSHQHLFISINLSARQFIQNDIITKIAKILEDENIYPGYLNLEITESVIMGNYKKINSMLSELNKMDIQIAIDNFGIGYTSLNNLHQFPIHALKIDRSFISAINGNEQSLVLPQIIINLGQQLEIDVVAEGIETDLQYDQLRKLDCPFGQGNYFSEPVDSKNAELLIMNNPVWK
ncbi:MAG: EAL domain-containing protein [Spirochaetota bacterium]